MLVPVYLIKFIEDDYIKWIFTGSKKKYYYISKNSKCYLLKKEFGKKYTILGEFNENFKENFEKIEKCNIYLYTPKKTFYRNPKSKPPPRAVGS